MNLCPKISYPEGNAPILLTCRCGIGGDDRVVFSLERNAVYRVLVTLGILASSPVLAHSWYDPECCDGRDCAVYIHDVERLPRGEFRLANGQIVRASKVKPSPDGQYHLCRWDGVISCFYAPAAGRGAAADAPGAYAPAGAPGPAGPILRRKY